MIITVTPEKAEQMIKEALRHDAYLYEYYNSPECKKRIKHYAKLMKKGRWKNTNNSPFIFFENSQHFFEGKHRLFAVIESGTTQKFFAIKWKRSRDFFFYLRENAPKTLKTIIKQISDAEADRFIRD
jgi:cyclophilin family peptidyl-prolyl cis-trans isomerase